MSSAYLLFLGIFLVLPAFILAWLVRPTRLQWTGIGLMLAITAVFGIPWDQWMAATGIWRYDPGQVAGIWAGYIPVEEVGFILLIPILVGLWAAGLNRWVKIPAKHWSILAIGLALLLAAILALGRSSPLPQGSQPDAYLVRLLGWSVPVILGQIVLSPRALFSRWQVWVIGALTPAIYLSAADAIALSGGVWKIAPDRMANFLLPGNVPVEELLFFLVTALMIVQGLVLFWNAPLRARAQSWLRERTGFFSATR